MAHDDLVSIFLPSVRRMRPPTELQHVRATRHAVDDDGGVAPEALRQALPWQPRDFSVSGAVSTGVDVAQQYRVRQPMKIVYLDAAVKTAPSGGALVMSVAGENISIAAGQTTGTSPANRAIPAGTLLALTVSNASGAADLTVTVWLVPDAG